MLKRNAGVLVGVGLLVAAGSASAAIDVTSTVTAINDTLTPIGLIGAAVLAVYVALKAYKWVRRAM